jgi:hypothetical protein
MRTTLGVITNSRVFLRSNAYHHPFTKPLTLKMSFQNYGDSFQGQQPGAEETGGQGPPGGQPQQQMGQPMDQSPNQFQGGNGGPAGGAPPAQSGDSKTTLWFVIRASNYTQDENG